MARTVTLTQLQEALSDRCDVTIGTGYRHTTTLANARLNRSMGRWKLIMAEAGDDSLLLTTRVSTTTSATKDAANWAPREYIAQPSGLLVLRSMVIWDSDQPVHMMEIGQSERLAWLPQVTTLGTAVAGMPVFYRLGGTNNAGSALVQLYPYADAVYSIDVSYIPAHTDLSSGSSTVEVGANGDEWIVNDAAIQTLANDGLLGTPEAQALQAWNAKLEREARFAMACRGAREKYDAGARKRELMSRAFNGWRGV
jgi:hypothetical protein